MILLQRSMLRPSAPWWAMTALAVALCIAFAGLGRWQWQRGQARQKEWDAFARGADEVRPLGASKMDDVPRFARVALTGRFRPDRQFLLDNRSHGGQPGYEVLTPLELAGGRALLVDRGWVAFTGSRARLPDVSFAPAPAVTQSRFAGSATAKTRTADDRRGAGSCFSDFHSAHTMFGASSRQPANHV